MTIAELYNRARKVNLRQMSVDIVSENRSEMIQLNQDQLYFKSEDSNGKRLKEYNSLTYALIKSTRNPNIPFGAPDLYDTGNFYKGFYAQVTSRGSFRFGSKDDKQDDLIDKYGINIFGLNSDSKTRFVNEVLFPEIKQNIYFITGLTFS